MSKTENSATNQRQLYVECLEKQIEELQLLTSIYCGPGELVILDPLYVCEFENFLKNPQALPASVLHTLLEFVVKLEVSVAGDDNHTRLEVRVQLPHLYPSLEQPTVTVQSSLLSKAQTQQFKAELNLFMETIEKQTACIYQLLTWIQENVEEILKAERSQMEHLAEQQTNSNCNINNNVDFERLWIYSHHIKAKSKRAEIIKQSRELNLSGFSRPGKPGIICVEGMKANTQEFWRIIKSMRWQKIGICKSEIKRTHFSEIDKLRRFEGFKEQLFCDDVERDDVVMDMREFVKYLETHNSAYMKKELFGFD